MKKVKWMRFNIDDYQYYQYSNMNEYINFYYNLIYVYSLSNSTKIINFQSF